MIMRRKRMDRKRRRSRSNDITALEFFPEYNRKLIGCGSGIWEKVMSYLSGCPYSAPSADKQRATEQILLDG